MAPLRRVGRLFVAVARVIDERGPVMTALATTAIAVLTGSYVVYSQRQWQTMESTLDVARQQTRPYVGIESIAFHGVHSGEQPSVTATLENTGETPKS